MNNNEINLLVTEKIMGLKGEHLIDGVEVFKPSENIEDAWSIIERFKYVEMLKRPNGYICGIWSEEQDKQFSSLANTAPMAICLAALKLKGITVNLD